MTSSVNYKDDYTGFMGILNMRHILSGVTASQVTRFIAKPSMGKQVAYGIIGTLASFVADNVEMVTAKDKTPFGIGRDYIENFAAVGLIDIADKYKNGGTVMSGGNLAKILLVGPLSMLVGRYASDFAKKNTKEVIVEQA